MAVHREGPTHIDPCHTKAAVGAIKVPTVSWKMPSCWNIESCIHSGWWRLFCHIPELGYEEGIRVSGGTSFAPRYPVSHLFWWTQHVCGSLRFVSVASQWIMMEGDLPMVMTLNIGLKWLDFLVGGGPCPILVAQNITCSISAHASMLYITSCIYHRWPTFFNQYIAPPLTLW